MGDSMAMKALRERAAFMRESLQKSQIITDNVVAIIGSFDHYLSVLGPEMRPTQAEAKILRGPYEDPESYIEAVHQLRRNAYFSISNKSFKSSDGVLSHANNLLVKAILELEEDFKQLLTTYSDRRAHLGTKLTLVAKIYPPIVITSTQTKSEKVLFIHLQLSFHQGRSSPTNKLVTSSSYSKFINARNAVELRNWKRS